MRIDRWVDSLHEDHNGIVWTTKAELRQVFLGTVEELPETKICEVCNREITVEPTANSASSHDPGPHVVKSYSNLGPKRGLTVEELK